MNRKLLAAISAGAASALAAGSAQALVIDTYDTPQSVSDVPSVGESQYSEIFAPEAFPSLGGAYRALYTENNEAVDIGTSLSVRGGVLGFSNQVNASGRGWIVYDGEGGFDGTDGSVNTTGLGGVDFLIGPSPFMEFDVASYESNLDVVISAWDMDGNRADYTETLPPAGLFNPILPLADFVAAGPGSIDWSNVGALQFFVESFINDADPDGGYDGAIDRVDVNAIPLPATALLAFGGLGSFALVGARRRRRQ